MAERRQDNSCGEGCVPNMLFAAHLDRALFVRQEQLYLEHLWILRHIFTVVLPGREAKQDYLAI